jgi:cathepsin L
MLLCLKAYQCNIIVGFDPENCCPHHAFVVFVQVYSDFRSFFSDKRNAKAVYRPSPNATFQFAHAVTLVGYDNQKQYWLVKNSWGRSWGDDGFFRVSVKM